MIKRNFLFRLLFCFFSVIDDDGGGSSDAGQADATQNSSNNEPAAVQNNTNETPATDDDVVKLNKADFELLKNVAQERIDEKNINAADAAIKSFIPDFDIKKVENHLKELKKTDPDKAQSLNNPTGWLIVHNQIVSSSSTPAADAVNHGRHGNDSSNLSDLVSKIGSGNGGIAAKTALYEKFL